MVSQGYRPHLPCTGECPGGTDRCPSRPAWFESMLPCPCCYRLCLLRLLAPVDYPFRLTRLTALDAIRRQHGHRA
jgi:hypothetical protein